MALQNKEQVEGEVPQVTFSPEQIKMIDKMMAERLKSVESRQTENPNNAVSLYNLRDPKSIETVKVSRFDAKWVLGFKDLQNDPYKKTPKYLRYGVEPIRKLPNEPYVTLLLSSDGKKIEEKEVLLLDFVENREKVDIDVIKCDVKTIIHDHGILGATGSFGVAINEKGNPETRPTYKMESKSEERVFTVKLPGFDIESEFITDFLA